MDEPGDPVDIAARLLADGIPSRNRAFIALAEPRFAKGRRIARHVEDLVHVIRAMERAGRAPGVAHEGEFVVVTTVTETAAGPVRRTSRLTAAEWALVEARLGARRDR